MYSIVALKCTGMFEVKCRKSILEKREWSHSHSEWWGSEVTHLHLWVQAAAPLSAQSRFSWGSHQTACGGSRLWLEPWFCAWSQSVENWLWIVKNLQTLLLGSLIHNYLGLATNRVCQDASFLYHKSIHSLLSQHVTLALSSKPPFCWIHSKSISVLS